MRCCEIAFSSVVRTCSWPISSANDCGRYFLAMTWYMKGVSGDYARPRVIRGTRAKPLPLLPSGPGGVHSRTLHEARSLTTYHASMRGRLCYHPLVRQPGSTQAPGCSSDQFCRSIDLWMLQFRMFEIRRLSLGLETNNADR